MHEGLSQMDRRRRWSSTAQTAPPHAATQAAPDAAAAGPVTPPSAQHHMPVSAAACTHFVSDTTAGSGRTDFRTCLVDETQASADSSTFWWIVVQ